MDDELDKKKQLPAEMLRQMYGAVEAKEDRKVWQLVSRGWYHAVNDIARINVKLPTGQSSYKKLADDLAKYPTFSPKISSIVDDNKYYNYDNSARFEDYEEETSFKVVIGKCSSVRRLFLGRWPFMWFYRYLEAEDTVGGQPYPPNLEEIRVKFVGEEEMFAEGVGDLNLFYLH